MHDQIDFNVSNFDAPNNALFSGTQFTWQQCPSNPFKDEQKTQWGTDYDWAIANAPAGCYATCSGPTKMDGYGGIDCWFTGQNQVHWGDSWCSVAGSDWNNRATSANPGMFGGRNSFSCNFADVTDGLSNTIMLCERKPELSNHYGALSGNIASCATGGAINTQYALDYDQWHWNMSAASHHPGGAQFCLGDGSVRFLSETIDFQNYNYLGNRWDKQPATLP